MILSVINLGRGSRVASAALLRRALTASTSLESTLALSVQKKRENLIELKKSYANEVIGEVTVGMLVGGMRGIKGLLSEISLLDEEDGIRFRGYSIPELQKALPTARDGQEPLPEGMLWLLFTGDLPTSDQVKQLSANLHARSELPDHILKLIDSYPQRMHPMTQLSSAVLAMQTESKFAAAYQAGMDKREIWRPALEDSLDLIARLPEVASRIYLNVFHAEGENARVGAPYDPSLDYSANFARMLGFDDSAFDDLMRLYLTIHADHEGGNVSAHTVHLVGSALADPYLSFSAGLNGLAGPLHGLANQEVLRFLMAAKDELGDDGILDKERLREYVWSVLKSGKVIPGYGHAILRKTDPRYTCQREFALRTMPDDPMFHLVSNMFEVVPDVLTEHGKTKNPWPNVDAHSGVLLQHYGLIEANYYTVLFGVSRAIGVLANYVDARIVGLPIERPKSMTSEAIRALVD